MKRSLENSGMSPVRTKGRNQLYIAAPSKRAAPSSAGQEQDSSVQGHGLRRERAHTRAAPRGHRSRAVMATDGICPEQEHLQVSRQPCNYSVLQSELAAMLNPDGLVPGHRRLAQLH